MNASTSEFQYFVGIDWAREEHYVAVLSGDTLVGQRSFVHSGKGLRKLVDWLVKVCEAPAAKTRPFRDARHSGPRACSTQTAGTAVSWPPVERAPKVMRATSSVPFSWI